MLGDEHLTLKLPVFSSWRPSLSGGEIATRGTTADVALEKSDDRDDRDDRGRIKTALRQHHVSAGEPGKTVRTNEKTGRRDFAVRAESLSITVTERSRAKPQGVVESRFSEARTLRKRGKTPPIPSGNNINSAGRGTERQSQYSPPYQKICHWNHPNPGYPARPI